MADTYYIYRIVNFVNGKCYVGQTVDVKRRKTTHFSSLKNGSHFSQHLQNAYDMYGRKAFYFEVIEGGIPADQASSRETYWITKLDSFRNGYNKSPEGNNFEAIGIPCVWEGVEYPSIVAAARANNLSDATLKRWLRNGFTCKDDVKYTSFNAVSCEWNGKMYESISDAARSENITPASMLNYLKAGCKSNEDVRAKFRPYKQPIVWNGIEYESKAVLARILGINETSLKERLDKGYACDADLKVTPGTQFVLKPCMWNGVEYTSITEAAKACGIQGSAMGKRIRSGYTCDEDMKKPTWTWKVNHPNDTH